MRSRKLILLSMALLWAFSAYAQQQKPQPLTFWYGYTVKPGKEDEFLNLVKTVGQPVRDKLMADGVVMAWGVEAPILRGHSPTTHWIWYSVADWSGIEKVQAGLQAQIAKLDAEAAKPAEGGKKAKVPGQTIAQRSADVFDAAQTRDYVTRDLVFNAGSGPMPSGLLPVAQYNFVKAKPGKAAAFRATWEKYNKPVLDKLLANGTVLAYGFAIEEIRTQGDSTHFVWYGVKSLGDLEKVRDAFVADRNARSAEERAAIVAAFVEALDADASRSEVTRSLIFHLPGMK